MEKVVFLIQMLPTFSGRCNSYFWDIGLKILRLPNFNMLFRLVLIKFFKSALFSCLPKVDHVIKSCKEPIPHNQLLLTQFGMNFVILNRWCQNDVKKCSLVAGYWTIDRENLGTRLSCFGSYSKWKPNSRNAKYTLLDSITVTRCPLWNTCSSFFKPWPKRAGLSTLPYNPGDSRFWTVFPGLMIRFWNLLYNRRSLPFLVDSTFWQWNFTYFALFELFSC